MSSGNGNHKTRRDTLHHVRNMCSALLSAFSFSNSSKQHEYLVDNVTMMNHNINGRIEIFFCFSYFGF